MSMKCSVLLAHCLDQSSWRDRVVASLEHSVATEVALLPASVVRQQLAYGYDITCFLFFKFFILRSGACYKKEGGGKKGGGKEA